MKINMSKKMTLLMTLIFFTSIFITGCNKDEKGEITSSGPTIEDMENSSLDKNITIKRAIKSGVEIEHYLKESEEIDEAQVYINHEAVLVALKLKNDEDIISSNTKNEIKNKIMEIYPMARTIAISSDREVYESISRLVKTFKENDSKQEFIRDIKEIISNLKEGIS